MSTGKRTSKDGGTKQRRPRSHRPPNRWQKSLAWRRIASQALRDFHANEKHKRPRCGAHARTTGEPCRQLALANGRCHYHGGASPSGADVNTRQLRAKKPSRQKKSDWPKAEAKLRRWQREDQDRSRRLAMMSEIEFRSYFTSTHQRHDRSFRKIVDAEMARRGLTKERILGLQPALVVRAHEPPSTPDMTKLERRIAYLRELLSRVEAQAAEAASAAVADRQAPPPPDDDPFS